MTGAVHAFDGTVSAVMGDGVLALFGAPVAREDHAVRAAYAALQMLADVRTATGGAIDIRVGLHTGEVLLRTIETDLSRDYTALGPPVHLASRMERMAPPGHAGLTAQTARRPGASSRPKPWGPSRCGASTSRSRCTGCSDAPVRSAPGCPVSGVP